MSINDTDFVMNKDIEMVFDVVINKINNTIINTYKNLTILNNDKEGSLDDTILATLETEETNNDLNIKVRGILEREVDKYLLEFGIKLFEGAKEEFKFRLFNDLFILIMSKDNVKSIETIFSADEQAYTNFKNIFIKILNYTEFDVEIKISNVNSDFNNLINRIIETYLEEDTSDIIKRDSIENEINNLALKIPEEIDISELQDLNLESILEYIEDEIDLKSNENLAILFIIANDGLVNRDSFDEMINDVLELDYDLNIENRIGDLEKILRIEDE